MWGVLWDVFFFLVIKRWSYVLLLFRPRVGSGGKFPSYLLLSHLSECLKDRTRGGHSREVSK